MTEANLPQFPRRGEIWSVELPNQPADPRSSRPALVVSIDVRNRLANDVVVVPLTTTLRPLPTHVMIPAGAGGQRYDSMAKCEQITTLDKRFLVRGPSAGRVAAPLLEAVVRGIRRTVGDALP